MKKRRKIVASRQLADKFITILIILNMVVAGLLTDKAIKQDYGHTLMLFFDISSVIFIIEMIFRIAADGEEFFWEEEKKEEKDKKERNWWNLFDLIVTIFSKKERKKIKRKWNRWNLFDLIVTIVSSASLFFTNNSIIALRVFRQIRALRIFSEFKNLRIILDGLMDSISKLAFTSIFFFVMYYIYAIIGIDFYGEDYPQWFGNIGIAMFTLFQIMTLEGWAFITEEVMKTSPWAWVYFISFILIVSYILINLIVGIIVSSLREKVDDEIEISEEEESIEQLHKKIDEIKELLNAQKKMN